MFLIVPFSGFGLYYTRKGGEGMDITPYMRRLEALGFADETLERAIVEAGASRTAYLALFQAVEDGNMPPAEAVYALKNGTLLGD